MISSHIPVEVEKNREFMNRMKEVMVKYGYTKEIERVPPLVKYGRDWNHNLAQIEYRNGELYIKMGKFMDEEDNLTVVMSLAHELGHFYDITKNYNGIFFEYAEDNGVLELEIRAWEYGIRFLREIGMGTEYDSIIFMFALECLDSYYCNPSYIRDFNDKYGFAGKSYHVDWNGVRDRINEVTRSQL